MSGVDGCVIDADPAEVAEARVQLDRDEERQMPGLAMQAQAQPTGVPTLPV